MARSLSLLFFFLACLTATAVAAAEKGQDDWTRIPNAKHNHHVQKLGRFAVNRHNEQTHDHLKFKLVTDAWRLDRGTDHWTYRMILTAQDGHRFKLYVSEVLEDKSGKGEPNVLNFGFFNPKKH